MGARHLVAMVALIAGCRSTTDAEVWRIELAGHTVGTETVTVTPDGWHSERSYRMVLGDEERAWTASSDWAADASGVRMWSSEGRSVVFEEPYPSAWRFPPEPGERRVFDPASGEVREGRVWDEGQRRWFDDGRVRWWSERDGEDAVAMGTNALAIRRVAEVEPHSAIDPAEVLALSVPPPQPSSSGVVFADMRVTGPARALVEGVDAEGRVQVHRPLWLEVGAGEPVVRSGPIGSELSEALAAEVEGMVLREAVEALIRVIPERMTFSSVPVVDPAAALHGAQGDCTEHAALLVSVLSRLGHPAEVRVGWRYREGRFYPHAWVRTELPVAGVIDVDPTWGERIATPLLLSLHPSQQARPWEALGRSVGSSVTVISVR